jgi:hypothetical protein
MQKFSPRKFHGVPLGDTGERHASQPRALTKCQT